MKKNTPEQKELHTIRYEFGQHELKDFSNQLAVACRKKAEVEEEKKSVVSQFKATIDNQEAQISILSSRITNGYEYRNVDCVVKKDFKKGIKQFYFEGTLYDESKLSPEDYQLKIED
jgi:hypothetical protein